MITLKYFYQYLWFHRSLIIHYSEIGLWIKKSSVLHTNESITHRLSRDFVEYVFVPIIQHKGIEWGLADRGPQLRFYKFECWISTLCASTGNCETEHDLHQVRNVRKVNTCFCHFIGFDQCFTGCRLLCDELGSPHNELLFQSICWWNISSMCLSEFSYIANVLILVECKHNRWHQGKTYTNT